MVFLILFSKHSTNLSSTFQLICRYFCDKNPQIIYCIHCDSFPLIHIGICTRFMFWMRHHVKKSRTHAASGENNCVCFPPPEHKHRWSCLMAANQLGTWRLPFYVEKKNINGTTVDLALVRHVCVRVDGCACVRVRVCVKCQ